MEKPKTLREMVFQLWLVVLGSNGDGLIKMMQNMRDDLDVIKEAAPNLWTRKDEEAAQKVYANNRKERSSQQEASADRRKISIRDWVMISVNVAMMVGMIIALVAHR